MSEDALVAIQLQRCFCFVQKAEIAEAFFEAA